MITRLLFSAWTFSEWMGGRWTMFAGVLKIRSAFRISFFGGIFAKL
jgi:hypothetical protein